MSTSVSKSSRKSNAFRLKSWVSVLGGLLIALILFGLVWSQGHVTGKEFAPSHFHQRDFSFYEIPILHIQITPIKRSAYSDPTNTFLRQKSLVRSPSGQPDNWHLVYLSRGVTGTTPADAKLLIDALDMYGNGQSTYWVSWSQDHPKLAKVFWPIIQRLSERELYLLLPSLFEIAQRHDSADEMLDEIDTNLQRQYADLVRDMRDAKRNALADTLLQEAIRDYPNNRELKELKLARPTPAPDAPAAPDAEAPDAS